MVTISPSLNILCLYININNAGIIYPLHSLVGVNRQCQVVLIRWHTPQSPASSGSRTTASFPCPVVLGAGDPPVSRACRDGGCGRVREGSLPGAARGAADRSLHALMVNWPGRRRRHRLFSAARTRPRVLTSRHVGGGRAAAAV